MAFLAIGSAKQLDQIPLGPYVGVLLGEVESVGFIQYGYVLDVLDPRTGRRVYAVASEKNAMAGTRLGGGSHFLCGYEGGTHANHGASDDWADRDKFLARALELARTYLKLPAGEGVRAEPAAALATAGVNRGDLVNWPTAPARTAPPPAPAANREPPGAVEPPAYASPGLRGAMMLSLIGVGVAAVPLALFMMNRLGIEPLREVLVRLGPVSSVLALVGYTVFAVGALSSARATPDRPSGLGFAAAGLAGAAAALVAVRIALPAGAEVGRVLRGISSSGLFMVAVWFHALFLIDLARRMGLVFGVQQAYSLAGMWGLLTLVRLYVTWMKDGFVPVWVDAATLLGLGVWTVFHLVMLGKVRGASGG